MSIFVGFNPLYLNPVSPDRKSGLGSWTFNLSFRKFNLNKLIAIETAKNLNAVMQAVTSMYYNFKGMMSMYYSLKFFGLTGSEG